MHDTSHKCRISNRAVGSAPLYCQTPCASRSLHSLVDPSSARLPEAFRVFSKCATAQSRSFAFVVATIWNDLPQQLRFELLTLPLPVFFKRPEDCLFLLVVALTLVGNALEYLNVHLQLQITIV